MQKKNSLIKKLTNKKYNHWISISLSILLLISCFAPNFQSSASTKDTSSGSIKNIKSPQKIRGSKTTKQISKKSHKLYAKVIMKQLTQLTKITFHKHHYNKSIVKPNRSTSHSRKPSKMYVLPDASKDKLFFSNQGIKYLQKNDSDDYTKYIGHLHHSYSGNKTPIYKQIEVNGYHFDEVHIPKYGTNNWVINTDLSTHKNGTKSNIHWYHFLKRMENQYIHKYFNSTNINLINKQYSRYNYLIHHENNKVGTVNQNCFRRNVIDWVDFYRNTIYKLPNVTEYSSYDKIAQKGANTNKDPEDMDWGSITPQEAVSDYFTDANDIDNDGQTGHRYSILNPTANKIGVGQYKDRNSLFFNWGENGNNVTEDIDYPRIGAFPLSDAKEGEYWSYEMSYSPETVTIWIRDETNHNKVIPIKNINLYDNIAYYKINPKDLKSHHVYRIFAKTPHHKTYWYETQLYNINNNEI